MGVDFSIESIFFTCFNFRFIFLYSQLEAIKEFSDGK